ncbi:Uncharacterised protein [Mycobacteroides abscessus]|nr:Uncharacterised protein [Mycobacteroides abscessus]
MTFATPRRVEGVFFWSPYTRLGFSPSADFTETASRITCSSTVRPPHVLIATVCPPMGLPEPGFTTALVTPPTSASRKPSSSTLIASIARSAAPFGSVISFVSLPAQPSASSMTPMWACASTKPGSTQRPRASRVGTPSGTTTSAPTAVMTPSSTRTVPFSMGSDATGTT